MAGRSVCCCAQSRALDSPGTQHSLSAPQQLVAPLRSHFGRSPRRRVPSCCGASKAALKRAEGDPKPLLATEDAPVVIMGIDPDISGAVAVLEWPVGTDRGPGGVPLRLDQATVRVFDMPTKTIDLAARKRRECDPLAIAQLVHELLPTLREKAAVNILLEKPVPNPLNGKFAWYGSGLAYGIWSGMLAAYAIPAQEPTARRWKGDLKLNKRGKEGSRFLALQIFPQAATLLRRKKDHGRAESLLIAAWGSSIPISHEAFVEAFKDLDDFNTDDEFTAENVALAKTEDLVTD